MSADARRQRISTEVEQVIEINHKAVSKVKDLIQEQEDTDSLYDDIIEAVGMTIESHHPDGQTLCTHCMRLHVLVHRL